MLSMPMLAFVLGLGLVLALVASFSSLILFDLTLIGQNGYWSLGGVRLGPTDILNFCLLLAVLLRAQRSPVKAKIPYLGPWLVLVVVMCISYALSPENIHNLTNPVRITYQLYRYCVRPMLYFPLVVMLVRTPQKAHWAVTAVIFGALFPAIEGIRQGFSGISAAPGPFASGNDMAGFLIIPLVLAVAGAMVPKSRFHFFFCAASAVILARAMLFSASRGGMAAAMVGCGIFLGFLFLTGRGRRRLMFLTPAIVAAPIALIIVRPDVLQRSSVQHAMTLTEGTQANTMQWRMTQRWPLFIAKAMQHPFLGTGTAVDHSLGDSANTPHNGYIAVAVRNGFIVAGLYIFFSIRLVIDSVKAFFRAKIHRQRVFAVTVMSAALGLMAHNFIETTLTRPLMLKLLFLMCALGALNTRSDCLLYEEEKQQLAARNAPQPEDELRGELLPAV